MAKRSNAAILAFTTLLAVAPAPAWHGPGHQKATLLVGEALPKDLPAFFRDGAATIAHCSVDPDLFRFRGFPELRDQEAPEHFFDLELLEGADPPPTRYGFVDFCARKGISPAKIGLLPYALVEWTQRLTMAFAEHRKWPENPHIRRKCLVYAGILSHYAQDACQPLHTTIHYDGRARADGSSPRTGIHAKVDALLGKLQIDPKAAAAEVRPVSFDKLMPAVLTRIRQSNALVEEVYRLEAQLPAAGAPLPAEGEVVEFSKGHLRACAEFTGSLFLTAWRQSAEVDIPAWHKRPARVGK